MISIMIEDGVVHLTIRNEDPIDIVFGAVMAVAAVAASIEQDTQGRIPSEESMREIGKTLIKMADKHAIDATVIDLKALGKELRQ